jgi:hypothetical protein
MKIFLVLADVTMYQEELRSFDSSSDVAMTVL